jgi:hypothetical protein
MAALLNLPAGWFSLDGWRGLPATQKAWWGLGTLATLALSGVGIVLVLTLLGRTARPSSGYPSLDAVLGAVQLGSRVQDRFIRECKGGRGNTTDSLLEDIPSGIGLAEEKRWLDENRDLDKLESLLRRSIALGEGSPGPNQQLNIANAYSKLGYHYRFRRAWDQAINALGQAIERFTNWPRVEVIGRLDESLPRPSFTVVRSTWAAGSSTVLTKTIGTRSTTLTARLTKTQNGRTTTRLQEAGFAISGNECGVTA